MGWQSELRGDPLPWLLEEDEPGPRYLALRDLAGLAPDDPALVAARREAHRAGPIAAILAAMDPAGFWAKPGPGYGPKYRSTVWSLIMLAQLGASAAEDPRIGTACAYLLDHALAPGGQFTPSGAASSAMDCLQGNLCWALVELGCDDPRLAGAYDWMARTVTGDGIAPVGDKQAAVRYYAYKCGPTFACGANDRQPCAWGGVKVMAAFGRWPVKRRTPAIRAAIAQGAAFLLDGDPAAANYPNGRNDRPSSNWWKFGFPVFYVTDLLQNAAALVELGYGRDPRLADALQVIRNKQDAGGRWALEYDYTGKTWVGMGPKRKPNKWVTLRVLRVLKAHAETPEIALADCPVCSKLGDVETSFEKFGWPEQDRPLPPEAGRLEPVEPLTTYEAGRHHLRRCPVCGRRYRYDLTYEYLSNGSEEEEVLVRLGPASRVV